MKLMKSLNDTPFKLTPEYIENINSPTSIKEIEFIIQNFPQENSKPTWLTGEFDQHLRINNVSST